jgi:cyanoexosortase A
MLYSKKVKQLYHPEFWLLSIGTGWIAIQLVMIWRNEESSLWGMTFLFWAAIASLIWDKRDRLQFDSSIFSSFFSLFLMTILLIKCISLSSFGIFLSILPVTAGFSLALLASGFTGLGQYRGELLALLILGMGRILPSIIINIAPLTAKFVAFLLWYSGSEVVRSGININLPTGGIEVYSGCSGIELIIQLFGLSSLFILMFPLNLVSKILLPIAAIILGFITNGIRVALMAILVAQNQKAAFAYWHHGDGSLIFSLIAVTCLGIVCWLLLETNQSNKSNLKSIK